MSVLGSLRCRILIAELIFIPSSSTAEWLEFGAGCPGGSEPASFHNVTTDDFISFDVELRGLRADTVQHDRTDYLRFTRTPGTRPMNEVGYPELPVVTCFIAIPDESDIGLEFTSSSMSRIGSIPVYPSPLDSLVTDNFQTPHYEEFFRMDSAAYASSKWYPEEIAVLSGEFRLRDQRVAIVDVYPVQYLASEDSLRVWSDIELYLNFEGTEPVWIGGGLGYYDRLVGTRLLGYTPSYTYTDPGEGGVFRHDDILSRPPFVPDYMIIVADGLDGFWIDDFAEYRAGLNGFDVLIANVDDILDQLGGSPPYPTPDLIRDYTELIWNRGNPGDRPAYLLLIGDHEDVSCTTYPEWLLPTFLFDTGGLPYLAANDEWYTCFGDPRDEQGFPDMMVGRLPARDAGNLQDMLALIEDYEAEDIPPGSAARRYVARLAGTMPDLSPSQNCMDSLRQWMEYDWYNYYCGDGENTETNPDGSSMTSADWVEACTEVFEHGSQVLFYSSHGGVHYFECAMNPELGPCAGRPDSTFDDLDVRVLVQDEDHIPPLVLLHSCSQGTFNWTDELQYNSDYSLWNCYGEDPFYDFGVDCFAEELMKNTNSGAIGVFAASWASSPFMGYFWKNTIEQPFYMGTTRLGDIIASGRIFTLYIFSTKGSWNDDLGLYNLLGDPAVDIGDRVKFRQCCDLIISPADLEINRYPTLSVSGGSGEPELYVTVRNAGAVASGAFPVSLSVEYEETVWHLSARCDGLDPGEEETLQFIWNDPPSSVSGSVLLSAEADPEESTPDSWRGNNTAQKTVRVVDFYPNDAGWPVRTVGSVKAPPALADLDGDRDMEIVAVTGDYLISAFDHEDPSSPLWVTDPYILSNRLNPSSASIPAVGNVCGDELPEVVIDGLDSLFVFEGTSGELLYSFPHPDEFAWTAPHSVCLSDLEHEGPNVIPRDEIAVVVHNHLYILRVQNDALEVLDAEALEGSGTSPFSWVAAADIAGTATDELIISRTYHTLSDTDYSSLYLYDYASGEIYQEKEWNSVNYRGIPSAGSLPSEGETVGLSRRISQYPDYPPVYLMDADDITAEPLECQPPTQSSNHVLCSIMADWDPVVPGLDRIIANAENQAMAWYEDGDPVTGWENNTYASPGAKRPPFPALGELDDQDQYDNSDLIVATREGVVMAFFSTGTILSHLGFPYTLPSEVNGGFAVADIDNDGYVEVAFGTMDNYLHVWELGECTPGYSPWPQCQHDAARTGVLLEE